LRLLFVALWLIAACTGAWAQAEPPPNPILLPPVPTHEEVVHLSGDADRPVDLVTTLYFPEGPGPFPLAVVNHGVNGVREKPADMQRHRFTYLAYYFLSRGYAVALPMMRGYAGSGGAQNFHHCDLDETALGNGRDIAGVIAALGSHARIDTGRVVVAGQSFGGWNTLGLGAMNPPPAGVKGLVNFSGGMNSSGCPGSDGVDALVRGAARLGATTTLPSLWFYGENDKLFATETWRGMVAAYTGQGGHAALVDTGPFMDDSHQMLSHPESFSIWVRRLDGFLAQIGLPWREVQPAYMPVPVPPPSHFADADTVDAVPWIGDAGRQSYRIYLTRPTPRAFLVAPNGGFVAAIAGFDPLGRAEAACAKAHLACRPYAVDDDVVWVPPSSVPVPAASHFAAIGDVGAVPWVNVASRAAYATFLTLSAPRAFVVAPGGQSATTHGGFDPLGRALALCGKARLSCRPYAVDDQVVWRPPAQ
jgi:dienelactone hydrolase